jgi:two-component system nitrate/nitrite response regulator NarL
MLVDDDPDIMEIIKLELEEDLPCVVDTCNSGKLALSMAGSQAYDVIISDLRMPVMDGLELIRQLREDGCTAYLVIYSGQGMNVRIQEALREGADHYICRTGDPDKEFSELKEIIRQL